MVGDSGQGRDAHALGAAEGLQRGFHPRTHRGLPGRIERDEALAEVGRNLLEHGQVFRDRGCRLVALDLAHAVRAKPRFFQHTLQLVRSR